MKIQSRIQIEDFVHDIISMILPEMNKSDIRPAYQKTKMSAPAGKNLITQDGLIDGLAGYTNEDNFIYFYVDTGEESDSESELDENYNISYIRRLNVTVYCYGKDSSTNAILIKSMLRSDHVQHYMNFNGYYQYTEGSITPMFEDINEEWWERNDVSFVLTNKVDIEVPIERIPVLSDGADVNIFVDGEKRL